MNQCHEQRLCRCSIVIQTHTTYATRPIVGVLLPPTPISTTEDFTYEGRPLHATFEVSDPILDFICKAVEIVRIYLRKFIVGRKACKGSRLNVKNKGRLSLPASPNQLSPISNRRQYGSSWNSILGPLQSKLRRWLRTVYGLCR